MILLVIIVLFLVLGGGSYHGYRREYYGAVSVKRVVARNSQ